jgi:hypothetical protein
LAPGVPDILKCVAGLAGEAGSYREAVRLFGAAEAIQQRNGAVRFKIYDAGLEHLWPLCEMPWPGQLRRRLGRRCRVVHRLGDRLCAARDDLAAVPCRIQTHDGL